MVEISRDDSGALLIDAPWWHARSAIIGGLMLLAGNVALVVAVRYIVVVAQMWAMFIPLTLFLIGPLIAFHYSGLQSIRNRTSFRVTRETIEIAWGPHGASRRTLEVSRIKQVFVTGSPLGRATVWAWLDDGGVATLARQLPTDTAAAIEKAVEEHLGIVDQAMRQELPKGEALRAARRRAIWKPIAAVLIAIGISGLGVAWLFGPAISGVVAHVDVKDGPAELRFRLDDPTRVVTWVRMEIRYKELLGQTNKMYIDRLPHVFDVHVTIDDEEMVCSPFRVAWFETQSNTAGFTESSIGWFGRLEGCQTRLSEGPHRGEVYLEHLDGSQKVHVDRAEIILRSAD